MISFIKILLRTFAPQPFAAWVGAGAAVLGAVNSGNAASSAAGAQQNAANTATSLQTDMYNNTVKNTAPYLSAGQTANSALLYGLGLGGTPSSAGSSGIKSGSLLAPFNPTQAQLATSPGYQFTMQSGEQAIEDAASATGGVNSGATLKALTQFGQGTGSNYFQQAFNNYQTQLNSVYQKLGGLSSTGANAALGVGGIGTTAGANIAGSVMAGGNAAAAGAVGQANAVNSGISNISPWLQNLLPSNNNNNTQTDAPDESAVGTTGAFP